MRNSMISRTDRYRGALVGLAVGDAVGTTLEFAPRGSFSPITDMVGGGPFALPAGKWTDDTSMALCLGQSLLYCSGFNQRDQMNRYVNWYHHGYMSSTGECFDIGATVHGALERYLVSGDPYSGSTDPRAAGNGTLMRLAPVVMRYACDRRLVEHAIDSARTTHAAEEVLDATALFATQLRAALLGRDRQDILCGAGYQPRTPRLLEVVREDLHARPSEQIRASGYVIDSLHAALWCFATTANYRDAVLAAANLGDDADTTAAICGQLAGAFYGYDAIPHAWRERLFKRADMVAMADALLAASDADSTASQ